MSDDDIREEHPSYGLIGIAQGNCNKMSLVGSAVLHDTYLCLTIKKAVKYKNNYRERFFGSEKICEIYLSHAQLAEMLFSLNREDGIPCTINYIIGDEGLRPKPPYESPFKQNSDDLKAVLRNTLDQAKQLSKEAEDLIGKGISSKKDREHLKFLAYKIVQDIEMNIDFANRCIDEKIEKNISQAKIEIESFVDMKLKMIGVQALEAKVDNNLIQLTTNLEKDIKDEEI